MRLSAGLLALPLAAAYVPESTLGSDLLYAKSLAELTKALVTGDLGKHLKSQGVNRICSPQNFYLRKEYSTLSTSEKLDYTKAVKCLMSSPSKITPGLAPGAKSRYDDFVATHVNQTTTIHFTGIFFTWHRAFIWSFEQALRNECGYKGYLPYWNWGKSAKDPLNSPYFDGSPTSQGGNGVYAPHPCTPLGPDYCIPSVPGRGGGCVTGPYANFQANLSTVQNPFTADGLPPPGPIFSYQPRCMRRDISPELTSQFLGDNRLVRLLTDPLFTDLSAFQPYLEGGSPVYPPGAPNGQYDVGLHGGPHYTWGGDPGGDVFTSPGDPMFFLLHAMVDRVWWMWQNQRPVERAFSIHGTRTIFNDPPSPNATINDPIDMGWVQPHCSDTYQCSTQAHKHHVSTVAGLYCYVYA